MRLCCRAPRFAGNGTIRNRTLATAATKNDIRAKAGSWENKIQEKRVQVGQIPGDRGFVDSSKEKETKWTGDTRRMLNDQGYEQTMTWESIGPVVISTRVLNSLWIWRR
jgi:hypothetical protein